MILPPRWALLQPLLDQALDADEQARALLLQQLQAQDPSLAHDLQALLDDQAALQADGFLTGAASAQAFNTPVAGQRLGSWRLLRPIAEGGMGSVWLAQRDDGRFKGQAAVKLLNLSLTAGNAAERFQREGHILARLAHPHIARLFDAGVAPSGQPYLVLEHVQGLAIDQHCQQRRLDLSQRLRLFITLLDAVAHAHRHLVVHRDIKPANVLVSDDGQIKLLDFGIAKLTGPDEEEVALSRTSANAPGTPDHSLGPPPVAPQSPADMTQHADRFLTPGWAAPEQILGQAVTTATDVYALGMLLFVLLAGQHPLLRPGADLAEMLQDSTRTALPRLSTRVAPQGLPGLPESRLRRLLQGDLDHIVAKALQLEPQARYASAAELADDLQRHLQQQAVRARPPSLLYRWGRFAGRQRVPLAVLGAGLLVSSVLGVQAWQQREAARLNDARATSVDGLLQSLFDGMSPDLAAQRQFSARELLDRASSYLDSNVLLDETTKRSARRRMAQLYDDIGAYEPAMQGWRAEVAAAEGKGQWRAWGLAMGQLADCQIKARDYSAAQSSLQLLRAQLATRLAGDHDLAARATLFEGELAMGLGKVPQAQTAYAKALQIFDSIGSQDLQTLSRTAHMHGQAARTNGQMELARSSLQRALEIRRARGPSATVDRLHTQLQLGALESWVGRPRPAVELLQPVHTEMLARLGPNHASTVTAVYELTWALVRLGDFGQARRHLAQLRGGTDTATAWRTPMADLLEARMQLYSGRASEQVSELRRLLTVTEARETGASSRTEQFRRILGEALLRANQNSAALEALKLTYQHQLKLTHPTHVSVATTQVLLGCAFARLGQLALAREHWTTAEQGLSTALGTAHPFTVAAASYLALTNAQASPAHRQALATALADQLAWQDGAASLAQWLRATPKPPQSLPWVQLPVVL